MGLINLNYVVEFDSKGYEEMLKKIKTLNESLEKWDKLTKGGYAKNLEKFSRVTKEIANASWPWLVNLLEIVALYQTSKEINDALWKLSKWIVDYYKDSNKEIEDTIKAIDWGLKVVSRIFCKFISNILLLYASNS
jgi:hypothetical protein